MKNELFLPIPGFEKYQVSNYGRIHSLGREQCLKQSLNSKGYKKIALYREGKRYTKSVHRLVAEAFIPNPNDYPAINHKDLDKTNNHVSNLEWCTNKQNSQHYQKNGKIKKAIPVTIINVLTQESISFPSTSKASQYFGKKWNFVNYLIKRNIDYRDGYKILVNGE